MSFQNLLNQIQTLQFIMAGALPLVFLVVFYHVAASLLRRLYHKGKIREYWVSTWRHLSWFFYLAALYQPVAQILPQFSQGLSNFSKIFTSPLFGKESSPSLLALLLLLPIFFLASRLARTCANLLDLYLGGRHNPGRRLYKGNIQPLLTLSRYVLIVIFCLFGINLLGINLTSLGVVFGALGLGIGFGLQNMAANFVSGVTLLLSGHIQHGDFVRTQKAFGTVEQIGLISTIVLTTEHENLIIPNQYLLNEIIENASYNNNRMVQLQLHVGVSYESDLDQVVEILHRIVARNPYRAQSQQSRQPEQSAAESLSSHDSSPVDGGAPVNGGAGCANHSDSSVVSPRSTTQKVVRKWGGAVAESSTSEPAVEQKTQKPGQQVHSQAARFHRNGPTSGTLANGSNGIWLKGFGSSSIDFEARIMIKDIDVFRPAKHWFYMEVWREFKDVDITIPFPQMDLHFHNAEKEKVQAVTGFGT